jgi:hypothetical protein
MKNYFSEAELSCPCCGVNGFKPETLERFNLLRAYLDFPLPMSSMYRCAAYNKLRGFTDTHETGQAGDTVLSHKRAWAVLAAAPKFGFTGIGVKQKGKVSGRMIHLDDLAELLPNRPRPHIWSY